MNVVELTFARSLLLWPAGLIPVNLAFLALAWTAADAQAPLRLRARLRRHPIAIKAHFRDCLTLTYALPADVLRPLLPPGLELETAGGYGFVAVALVQAESLRPAGLPAALGQDFFLAGYRVFTTFRAPTGRRLRGLRILRSDANRARMVAGGNLLTHYNYHRCTSSVAVTRPTGSASTSDTPDHGGDLRHDGRPLEPGAAGGLAVRVGPRGAALRRSAAVHVRLRAGDARHHRDPGDARQLAARAGLGRRRAAVVLRSAGLPRLHADPGGGLPRRRHRLPLGARRPRIALEVPA